MLLAQLPDEVRVIHQDRSYVAQMLRRTINTGEKQLLVKRTDFSMGTKGVAHIYQKEFVPIVEAILKSPDPSAIFDDFQDRSLQINTNHQIHSLREILIAAVAECLNHDNHQISANAAIVLRENMILSDRASDIEYIITNLIEQVNDRRIQPSKEAALSLGFFLSTRPNDRNLPQWKGNHPMKASMFDRDIDQSRFVIAPVDSGYLHKVQPETIETAIETLVQNLDRKEYKQSTNWAVAEECGKAIGAIGYRRPELFTDTVDEIVKLLDEQDDRQAWIIYALTSIGYSRPDLLPDGFASVLEEFANETGSSAGWELYTATNIGYRKIGHAPIYLEDIGCSDNIDLYGVVQKLFNFMLGRYPPANDELIQAFTEIYLCRPDELTEILLDELRNILEGNLRTFDFPDNFMLLLKELAGVNVQELQPILDISSKFYRDHSESHYWYENALEFHRLVAEENKELLPNNLGDVIKEFIKDEKRHSVQTHGRSFLEEINNWDDDLFTTIEQDEVIDLTEELSEIEGLDIESLEDKSDESNSGDNSG